MLDRVAIAALALVGCGLPFSAVLAQTAPGSQPAAEGTAATSVVEQDFKFVTWEGTRGTNIFKPEHGEGTQFYASLTGAMSVNLANAALWELAAKTGYVWSHHGTQGQEATYDGPTDTVLAAKVTIGGFTNVSPFLSVNMNVPTGESFLPGQRRFVRMDPDLVELGAYGEGFNVNPAVGFTFAPTATFTLSPSIGYAWRGKFDREGGFTTLFNNGTTSGDDLTITRVGVDPGNALQASLTSVAKIGTSTVEGSFTYVSQSEVSVNGVPVGQTGAGYVASVRAVYPVSQKLSLDLSGGWSFRERNKVPQTPPSTTLPFGGGDLIEEAKNSNSNVLIAGLQPIYALTDQLALWMNYSFLWRDQNSYDIIEDRFIPGRVKHSLGLGFDYALSKTAVVSLSGSRFWAHDGAGPVGTQVTTTTTTASEILPERDYTGWTGVVSAKVQF
jgi:hypothetical protein